MIDLIPDHDQMVLVEGAGAFLTAEFSRDRLRAQLTAGQTSDHAFVRECGRLGWLGIALDGSFGGAGLGLVDETLLFRELGRHLVPGPFIATALAAGVAAAADRPELAGALGSGEQLAGLVEVASTGRSGILWDGADVAVLLLADLHRGKLHLVERSAMGVPAGERSIDDAYRPVSLVLEDLPDPLADAGERAGLLLLHGQVLVSAMLTGIAEQVRDDAAAYASSRQQFGKPIGSFQAVKHRCADMAVRCEAAWAQTAVAALRVDLVGTDALFDVSAAKVVAIDAAVVNARDTIQTYGGVGYTAEYDPHLFLKRAHVLEHQFGALRWHLSQLLDHQAGW